MRRPTATTELPVHEEPGGPVAGRRAWWRDAVGYEVYVRSFGDGDGDGLGDLPGIRARLPHLASLGVDVLWLTPFYPTPDADHGYDVVDHRAVDPRFGSVADLEALVDEAHGLGLRVVVDLVANHTSDRHPWFLAARGDRDAPERSRHVWADPAPDGGPPNNWLSHFGGPAWTLDEASGQYWLHLFLPEQPDLNWHDDAVREDFRQTLRFWLARGVDGFRVDVAHGLVKDAELRDNPPGPGGALVRGHPKAVFHSWDHVHDLDQPGNVEVYEQWRPIVDAHDAALVGEVHLADAGRVARYVGPDRLHTSFWFPALRTGWDAGRVRATLGEAVAASLDLTYPLSSHDDPYAVSRFGGGEVGRARALAYLTLLVGLPGSAWLHQGDELGLENAEVVDAHDPISTRNGGAAGRDVTRAPMPWEPGHLFGFSTAEAPWLGPAANRTAADTAAVQAADPDSHLSRVRRLLAMRRDEPELRGDLRASGRDGATWLDDVPGVVAFRRGDLVVACSFRPDEATLPWPGQVRFRSSTGHAEHGGGPVVLAPDEAVVVRLGA